MDPLPNLPLFGVHHPLAPTLMGLEVPHECSQYWFAPPLVGLWLVSRTHRNLRNRGGIVGAVRICPSVKVTDGLRLRSPHSFFHPLSAAVVIDALDPLEVGLEVASVAIGKEQCPRGLIRGHPAGEVAIAGLLRRAALGLLLLR